MERTQIYLSKEQKEKLKKLAKLGNKTMADCIREAVNEYITEKNVSEEEILDKTSGLWRERTDIDSEYADRLRKAWDTRAEMNE